MDVFNANLQIHELAVSRSKCIGCLHQFDWSVVTLFYGTYNVRHPAVHYIQSNQ
jgi:hypothetical protein